MKSITTTATSAVSPATVSAGARKLIRASVSENTLRGYTSALRRVDMHFAGAPITDAGFADYLAATFEAGYSPATLRMHMAAVSFRARATGGKSPLGALTNRAIQGAAREGIGRGRGQAPPVSWESADVAASLAGKAGSLRGIRDCAMILCASDCLLRTAEVAGLDVDDFAPGDGDGGTITIKRSKTDVEGRGAVLFIRARTVKAVQRWLSVAGIDSGPLFRSINRHGGIGEKHINVRSVRRVITARAQAAGVDGARGHSLRVGSSVSLCQAGASLPAIMAAGRWKTTTSVARYTASAAAGKGAVAALRPA